MTTQARGTPSRTVGLLGAQSALGQTVSESDNSTFSARAALEIRRYTRRSRCGARTGRPGNLLQSKQALFARIRSCLIRVKYGNL